MGRMKFPQGLSNLNVACTAERLFIAPAELLQWMLGPRRMAHHLDNPMLVDLQTFLEFRINRLNTVQRLYAGGSLRAGTRRT